VREDLIAPCGMNCSLCVSWQFGQKDLNRLGFHRKYCPGCIPRGEHCTFMGDRCGKLGKGLVRFCTECGEYPCRRLKDLDRRYRTSYHMSMLENLEEIRERGMEAFLRSQEVRWRCPSCGGVICCHNGLCLSCSAGVLLENRKYRWGRR